MPTTHPIAVKNLKLDLRNFRTVEQQNESQAIQMMATVDPNHFWGLMRNILEPEGYLPVENILVLKTATDPPELIVKEGNRRVAILKLVFGHIPNGDIDLPSNIANKIKNLSPEWKRRNKAVPCVIYEAEDEAVVDHIIDLTHGKGQMASRSQWTATARARHNQKFNNTDEFGLDLLEKYLSLGKNLSEHQKGVWTGDYPLSILDELLRLHSSAFGEVTPEELVRKYPAIQHRDVLDQIMLDIGLKVRTNKVGFKLIRTERAFAEKYGLPVPAKPHDSSVVGSQPGTTAGDSSTIGTANTTTSSTSGESSSTSNISATTSGSGAPNPNGPPPKPAATSVLDPRSVHQSLKDFVPRGSNRDKVVLLRDEAIKLNLRDTPLAFCFLLRSMFEISAKAYCADHASSGLTTVSNGKDRPLADVLSDIYNHMILLPNNKRDMEKLKLLHGAYTDISTSSSFLSVTSMNQLVHNPHFVVGQAEICRLFGNIFPLLKELNQ